MKNYQLHIKNNIDETAKNIIVDYWNIINDKFVFKISDLAKKYNIRQHEITNLAMANSHFTIAQHCYKCGDVVIEKFENKDKLKFYLTFKNRTISCQNCENERLRILDEKYQQQEEERTRRIKKEKFAQEEIFQLLLQNRSWENLNNFEYEILRKIIELPNLNVIKREIFKDNFQDKLIWAAINKIEKNGLIQVDRNGWKNSVTNISCDSRLKNYIKKPKTLKNVDYLGFSLAKREQKTSVRQPDYSGTFVLPTDVILKAGVKYIYGGWVQTDNSINLKFTPLQDIDTVKQTTIDQEPKILGDILKNMSDVIQNNEYNNEEDPF